MSVWTFCRNVPKADAVCFFGSKGWGGKENLGQNSAWLKKGKYNIL